jgi:hypothetical protein
MAIKPEEMQEIEKLLADDAPFVELRRNFPHLSWSRCDASDVIEEPFRSFGTCDLHLLDTSSHCPVVVSDPSAASGFIVAARSASR